MIEQLFLTEKKMDKKIDHNWIIMISDSRGI